MKRMTREQLLSLKQQEVKFLSSRKVLEYYDHPIDQMFYGVALRHDISVSYERPQTKYPCYGMEIEIGLHNVDMLTSYELKKCIAAGIRFQLVKMNLVGKFSLQEDGSVPSGFELVFAPFPIYRCLTIIEQVLGRHGLEWFGNNEVDAGVHITVDKFERNEDAVLFNNVWMDEVFRLRYAGIIGRAPTSYCLIRPPVNNIKELYKQNDKSAVHVRDNGSVEVRAFHSTLRRHQTAEQLRLVDAVRGFVIRDDVNTVQDVLAQLKKSPKWRGF